MKIFEKLKKTAVAIVATAAIIAAVATVGKFEGGDAKAQVVNGYWNAQVLAQQVGTNGLTGGNITNLIVAATTYTNFFRINCVGQKSITFEFDVQSLVAAGASSNITWGVYGNVTGNFPLNTNGLYGYNGYAGVIGQWMAPITNFIQTISTTSTTNNVALLTIPSTAFGAVPYLYLATINPQFTPTNAVVRYNMNQ